MALKEEYKKFTFDIPGDGHTDNKTGEPLVKGGTVYAVSRDAMYAGGAVLESTYSKMNENGLMRGEKAEASEDAASEDANAESKSTSSRIRGNVKD